MTLSFFLSIRFTGPGVQGKGKERHPMILEKIYISERRCSGATYHIWLGLDTNHGRGWPRLF